MKTLSIALCVPLAMALTACSKQPSPEAEKKAAAPAQEAVRPVRTIVVNSGNVADAMFLPGDVRARYEQRLGFRVGGKLASRKVEVGDVVKVGHVLATLDSQDVAPQINAQAAQLEAAKANTKLQTSDLARQQELREKGFISAAAMQRQEFNAESARAQERAAAATLSNAQNALAFQTLRADRAGVVVAVEAEVGSVLGAGQTVVRIAQSGEREVVVNVPERAVGKLQEGKAFSALVEAAGKSMVNVKLRELAPSADPISRTYAARFTLVEPNDAIKLGMTATVRIDGEAARAIVVPVAAIVTRDGQPRVWVVDPNMSVTAVNVTTGALTPEGIVVRSGLSDGQRVVVAGANLLVPSQKVRLEAVSVPTPQVSGVPEGKK
jgi:RND family efflux transporter MFP subunit